MTDRLKEFFDKNIEHPHSFAIKNGMYPDPLIKRLRGHRIKTTKIGLQIQYILKTKCDFDISLEEILIPNFESLTSKK